MDWFAIDLGQSSDSISGNWIERCCYGIVALQMAIYRRSAPLSLLSIALSFALFSACDVPTAVEYQAVEFPAPVEPSSERLYGEQWHYLNVDLPDAWGIVDSGNYEFQSVVVAVIDSGVLGTHEDLVKNLLFSETDTARGYDFYSDYVEAEPDENVADGQVGRDPDPTDPGYCVSGNEIYGSTWHGTHVTGTVAAAKNDLGVAGIGWRHQVVLPIRALSDCNGFFSDISDALTYAADVGGDDIPQPERAAKVINLSLGGSYEDPSMYSIVQEAVDKGITIVAASGNKADSGNSTLLFPAAFDNVLAVGATGNDNRRAFYSNYGPALDFVGPGGSTEGREIDCSTVVYGDCVVSTFGPADDDYDEHQGTSQATPHVAGIVALLYAYEPNLTQEQVYTILMETALDLGEPGWDEEYGHGLVQAGAALRYLIEAEEGMPVRPMSGEQENGGGGAESSAGGAAGIRGTQPRGTRPAMSGAIPPPSDREAYDATSVIVRVTDSAASGAGGADAVVSRLLSEYGLAGASGSGKIRTLRLRQDQSPAEMIEQLSEDSAVQYAQPNYRYRLIR